MPWASPVTIGMLPRRCYAILCLFDGGMAVCQATTAALPPIRLRPLREHFDIHKRVHRLDLLGQLVYPPAISAERSRGKSVPGWNLTAPYGHRPRAEHRL